MININFLIIKCNLEVKIKINISKIKHFTTAGITNPSEAMLVGRIIAIKIISTEVIAYRQLGVYTAQGLVSV